MPTSNHAAHPPAARAALAGAALILGVLLLDGGRVAGAAGDAVEGGAGAVLDGALRAHLAALEPLRGGAPSAQALAGRAVLITFFASWCPPCRIEFEHLEAIAGEFATEDLRIVAVNAFEDWWDVDPERLARFLDHLDPSFHVVVGTEETRALLGDVDRIPTLFVFDRAGRPVMHFVNRRGAAQTNAALERLRSAVAAALAGAD